MRDRQSILQSLKSIMARTVENGCTEAEAMQAAEIARRMIDKHDISEAELSVGSTDIVSIIVANEGKSIGPFKWLIIPLMRFCDVDCVLKRRAPEGGVIYMKRDKRGRARPVVHQGRDYRVTGFPEDVELFKYLLKVIGSAMDRDADTYVRNLNAKTGEKRTHRAFFQNGFVDRVGNRMDETTLARRQSQKTSDGKALIPLKMALIHKTMRDLKMVPAQIITGKMSVDPTSFQAGARAGDKVHLGTAIPSASGNPLAITYKKG